MESDKVWNSICDDNADHFWAIYTIAVAIPNSLSWAHTYGHTDPDLYCDLNVVSDTKFVADIYIYPIFKSSWDG